MVGNEWARSHIMVGLPTDGRKRQDCEKRPHTLANMIHLK